MKKSELKQLIKEEILKITEAQEIDKLKGFADRIEAGVNKFKESLKKNGLIK